MELTQVELSREKIKNVDLQNSVATALGSESSAVKRAGESLAALSDARLAVKAKDAEREALISTASLNRKKLVAKFVSLVESGGQLKELDERMIGKKQQKFRSTSSEYFIEFSDSENDKKPILTSTSCSETSKEFAGAECNSAKAMIQSRSIEDDEQLLRNKRVQIIEWLQNSVGLLQGAISLKYGPRSHLFD